MESLQRVKLAGFEAVISELETEPDYLRRRRAIWNPHFPPLERLAVDQRSFSGLNFAANRLLEMLTASDHHDPQFHYRPNPDGTVDSICAKCFLTVGTADSFDQLHEQEASHLCINRPPESAKSPRR